jgi:hypothetical protein
VHGLDLAVEEEVEEQGLDEIVGVVAEGDLVAAQLVRVFVERPSAQARSEQKVSPGWIFSLTVRLMRALRIS